MGQDAQRGAAIDQTLFERFGQEPMRPLDHHLVGLREPQPGGEHAARVAHRHVVGEELPTRETAAAKSIAPNTNIRGDGVNAWTNTATSVR